MRIRPAPHEDPARWSRRRPRADSRLGTDLVFLFVLVLTLVGTRASAPGPEQGTVSGIVKGDKGPLAGAVVRVKGKSLAAATDDGGRFILGGLEPGRSVPVTAWAPGYYIGGGQAVLPGGPEVEITLKPYAAEDDPRYAWLPSLHQAGAGENQGCAECHSRRGTDVSEPLPVDEWLEDAHSRSAVNPKFLTMYEGSDIRGHRSPETRYFGQKDYGTFPLPPDIERPYYGPGYRLDFPETAGNCAACHAPLAAVSDPVGTDPRGLSGTAGEGISCDLCHKVVEVKLDPSTRLPRPNAPGVLSLEFRRPPAGHQFFAGPYDDVAPGEDTYAPVQKESRMCAACHFGVFWETTVYDSYGEWLASPYSQPGLGKTCQDCHMPPNGAVHAARPDKGGIARDPAAVFSHRMPGAADQDLLRNAVRLDLAATRDGARVSARVTIRNDRTGHHVPTDSPLRQMILLVEAAGKDGRAWRLVNGPTLPSWCGEQNGRTGHYAGLPGVVFAKVLEEMWTHVKPTGAYWNPTRVVSDSRLAAFASNASTYVFEGGAEQDVEIRARLVYRRAFIDLMEVKGWDAPDILMNETRVSLPAAGGSPTANPARHPSPGGSAAAI
jgi:mono/diheme cytochrome c family protein